MDFENSTEPMEAQSGEQQEAVAPAVESRTEEAVAGQEGAVGPREESEETADASGDGAGVDGDTESQQEKPQSREENAAIRAARLRARREAEEAAGRAAEERFARAGVTNPMTGKPFASLREWEDYAKAAKQQELADKAEKTGRSVEELSEEEANREFLTRLRKDAEQRKANDDFFRRDALAFVERYPQFGTKELARLEQDKSFRRFCGSRFGKEPLAELYGDYLALTGDAGREAVAKAGSKAARSTGGGTGGGAVLSPAQRAELDAWNTANPGMAMTAKEFLGR